MKVLRVGTRWVLGADREILKWPEKIRRGTVENRSHQSRDWQELFAAAPVSNEETLPVPTSGSTTTPECDGRRRQEIVMKYATNEILILASGRSR